jgi:hypothetical protein
VKTITLAENIQAPIQKGGVLGTFEVSYDGQVYGTAELVALSDVERSTFLYFMDCLSGFLGKTLIRIIAASFFS